MRFLLFFIFFYFIENTWAQSIRDKVQAVDSIEVYMEGYYGVDLAHPSATLQPTGIYNHKKLNQPSVNMAMFRWRRTSKRYRWQCSWMLGDYAKYNLAHEPLWLRPIYELNAGVKLSSSKELWLDAGVMSSPIGFESVVGIENFTLTRSLSAENTPYYVNGLRLSYTGKKWMASLWLNNGWQTIAFNSTTHPTGATQIHYTSVSGVFKWALNTMWGNYDALDPNRWRTLINTYAFLNLNEKSKLIGSLDVGSQQVGATNRQAYWLNPTVKVYFQPVRKVALSIRGEIYHDPQGINFISTDGKGMTLSGASVMYQYQVTKFCWWRTELRYLQSTSSIFYDMHTQFNNQWHWSTSLILNWRGLK